MADDDTTPHRPWLNENGEPTKPQPEKVPELIRPIGRLGKTANPKSHTSRKLARRTVENLTPAMKMMRDRFIAEYLKDWRGPEAYIRAGGPATTATKMAHEFLREPYVASRIWEVIDSMEEADLINRKRIIAMLIREANYIAIGASHSARVAALAKLANILGMDSITVKGDVNHTVRGGVMVVPVVPGSDEWEKLASNSQKQLKDDVRT